MFSPCWQSSSTLHMPISINDLGGEFEMKKYETPELEIIRFAVDDIITTSDNEFDLDELNNVDDGLPYVRMN